MSAPHEPPVIGWPEQRGLVDFGGDLWRVKDACEGTVIFGGTGSGKTSGSGRALATAFLAAGFGGLVLCANDCLLYTSLEELFENASLTSRVCEREIGGRSL